MSTWFIILCQFSILAFALIGGVFLAFSDFVMRSLSRTGGVGGIDAMQVINREVFRYVFMALLLGMVLVSAVLAGYGAFAISGTGAKLISSSGVLYLIGCFGITMLRNVPLNNALAPMDLASEETQQFWVGTYLPRWTFWNSVRATACAAASAILLMGLLAMVQASPA